MKEITLEELTDRDYNPSKISNYKLHGVCIKCNQNFTYSNVKKFLRTRKDKTEKKDLWNTCSKCWLNINTALDPNWILKNSQAQIISQNKSEQKKKNAEGVSKSWTEERKLAASIYLKSRWENDPEFKIKALKNLEWTQFNDARYYELMQKSWGTGGLKGKHNNITYESSLELAYILYCNDNNINIKRYDLSPINYQDENNISRLYIPDFISNYNVIIEIKGFGIYYRKNFQRNICKILAVKEFVKTKNLDFRLILENDDIIKRYYKKARKLHHETKEKNNDQI